MDTYASQGSTVVFKEPLDREEAATKFFIENYQRSCSVRISVEGFIRPSVLDDDELKIDLIEHFKSCGYVEEVVFPPEPLLDRRVFLTIHGDGAEEKALQLNGSVMGGQKVLVKVAPEEEEEEYKVEEAYRESLCTALENDKRFLFGVCVVEYEYHEGKLYDSSRGEDEVERSMRAHFSSCGEITHVFVNLCDKMTNIYFSKKEGEDRALGLDGSEVYGIKISVVLVTTTVRSERATFCCPAAHMLEFSDEIQEKIDFYMTEWRLKTMTKKLRALKKQKGMALGEPKAKVGACKKVKL